MRILLVDDDPIIRDLLSASLTREGFSDVTLAYSGKHALELVSSQETPFDCYLLDIMMKEIDGIELCCELRQRPECRTAPIVMITSGQASEFMDRAFHAGATDFLTKPLNHIEVAGRLKTAMLLVEATRQGQRGRQALRTLLSHATDLDLLDVSAGIRFPNVSGMLDYFELENRLLRLKDGQYQISLCRIQVTSTSRLGEVDSLPSAIQLIYSLSVKIGETIPDKRHWFVYIGSGRFICCVVGRPTPLSSPLKRRLEDAAQSALDCFKGARSSGISTQVQPLTEKYIISKESALKLIRREVNLVSASAAATLPEVDEIEDRIFAKISKVCNGGM